MSSLSTYKARIFGLVVAGAVLLLGTGLTSAKDVEGEAGIQSEALTSVDVEQLLGQQVSLNLSFTNSEGQKVKLDDLVNERPVILAMVYYECPMLCTMVLNGLLRMMNVLKFDAGKEFDVIVVSIDPRETAVLAANKKREYIKRYKREGADKGWHFLVGEPSNISALAKSVGFRYTYDERTEQYAHGSAIMVLTPQGLLSKYFYGIDYSPRDVRLALVEAADEKIGSIFDGILLRCFHYDPLEGKYSVAIMGVLRLAGVLTVLGILGFIGFNVLRERRRVRRASALS